MDKKKKKTKRKAKAAANAGEPSVSDHSQVQHRSSEKTQSVVAEENEILAASLPGSISQTELRKEEKGSSALAAAPLDMKELQSLELSERRLADVMSEDVNNLGTTEFSDVKIVNGEHSDSCTNDEQVERVQMQALIIKMTQMQALALEKERVVRELEELQEALAIERETAELLRDQMTYLQGHIAERDILETETHQQVQRLNADNVYLQVLVGDLTEKVQKLEEDLERAQEERGKLDDENNQTMSRKEKEEGERVAELIKKVERLEHEREDLEEKQSKLKQEGRRMIVKMEHEGEKMEQLSRQMVAKMETERQDLEQEIRQMTVKMEQEQQKLEVERSQMKANLEQERLKFDQENKQKIAYLTAEAEKLEIENKQLLLTIEHEREAFNQEKHQVKAIIGLERETLEQELLRMSEKVAQERKRMEFENEQKKEQLERDQEMLEHDRRQITTKLTALNTQLEQLEREASIRDRVFKDLASATEVDSSKKWESWRVYGKDPLAEAIAVAEEARMQRMAMGQTVDKLLAENVELMEKVNDQAIMINDLTKRMSSDAKTSTESTYDEGSADDAQDVIWRPDMEANGRFDETRDSTETDARMHQTKSHGLEHYGGHMNGHAVQGINGYISDRGIDESIDISTRKDEEESTAAKSSKLDSFLESNAFNGSRIPLEKSGSSESYTTLYEITEIREDSSVPQELVKSNAIALNKSPGKAGSLIKAPVRFLSFVAGYISGADLVKN